MNLVFIEFKIVFYQDNILTLELEENLIMKLKQNFYNLFNLF